jgi:protein-arginine kinase activator protein McsA
VYEDVYEEKYPANYFMKKENVIKYLSAWIKILTETVNYSDNRNELEANLLNAVAEERYEDAAEIRNRLAILN